MKKLLIMAICALALGSCVKEQSAPADGGQTQGGVRFSLRPTTGAPRSRSISLSDTIPDLNDVRVHAFKKSGDVYLYDTTFVLTWEDAAVTGSYESERDEMLDDGDYRFLGVGMYSASDYSLPTLVRGSTTFAGMVATVAAAGGRVGELFSGFRDSTIDESVEQVEIMISRQVAGFLGYFQNVPTMIGGVPVRNLKLTASSDYNAVNLATSTGQGTLVPNYAIIDVDMRSPLQDSVQIGGGTWVFAGNAATDSRGNAAVKLPNTQLAAGYAIPYSPATLTLGLYDAAGNPLRTWQIAYPGGGNTISLEPNELFALGRKIDTASTDGGGTADTTDDDAPVDLSLSQILTVLVEGGWGNVQDMTLQPQQ